MPEIIGVEIPKDNRGGFAHEIPNFPRTLDGSESKRRRSTKPQLMGSHGTEREIIRVEGEVERREGHGGH